MGRWYTAFELENAQEFAWSQDCNVWRIYDVGRKTTVFYVANKLTKGILEGVTKNTLQVAQIYSERKTEIVKFGKRLKIIGKPTYGVLKGPKLLITPCGHTATICTCTLAEQQCKTCNRFWTQIGKFYYEIKDPHENSKM